MSRFTRPDRSSNLSLFRSLHPQIYQDAMEDRLTGIVCSTRRVASCHLRAGEAAGAAAALAAGAAEAAGSSVGRQRPTARRWRLCRERALNSPVSAESLANQQINLAQGIAADASAAETGALFQYQIKAPVTLPRQRSAMLPIVNQEAAGAKVSIYNESVQAKYPLNGIRLTNTTGLNLMQGPITVFDGGAYAGDARIEDLAPGQDRLLSYGLDLKTEVAPENQAGGNELVTVVIKKGTVIASRKYTNEKTYPIRNRDDQRKTVLVEHPIRPGWELVEPATKPERARDVYRFAVPVDAGQTAKLVVQEENQISESALLSNANDRTIADYLRARKLSAKVRDALKKVTDLRAAVDETTLRPVSAMNKRSRTSPR